MPASYHLVKVYRLRSGMSKVRLAKLSQLTPRIIHMIENNPDYNPSRRTMLQLSNALGLPPSVIFFPQEEVDKRQMLSNMIILAMETMKIDEKAVYQHLQEMALNNPPPPVPRLPVPETPLPARP